MRPRREQSQATQQAPALSIVKTADMSADKVEPVMTASRFNNQMQEWDQTTENTQEVQRTTDLLPKDAAEELEPTLGNKPSSNSKQRRQKANIEPGSMHRARLVASLQDVAASSSQDIAIQQASAPRLGSVPSSVETGKATSMSTFARDRQRKKSKAQVVEVAVSAGKAQDILTADAVSMLANTISSTGRSKSVKQRRQQRSKSVAADKMPNVSEVLETSLKAPSMTPVQLENNFSRTETKRNRRQKKSKLEVAPAPTYQTTPQSEPKPLVSGLLIEQKKARPLKDLVKQQPAITTGWRSSTHATDTLDRHLDDGHSTAQIFGTLCQDIVTEQMRICPPLPNAQFIYEDFVDPVEKQFRKEYQTLYLASYNHFYVKCAIQPATNAPVCILATGFSEPKFFLINCDWDLFHLVPLRLFVKDAIRFLEVRFNGQWQRLPVFLDSLVQDKKLDHASMSVYWKTVREKKSKSFRFMDLPLELRQNVYRHAMLPHNSPLVQPQLVTASATLSGLPDTPCCDQVRFHHALVGVNHRIREEALEEYYRVAFFGFDRVNTFMDFWRLHEGAMLKNIFLRLTAEDHDRLLDTWAKCGSRVFICSNMAALRHVVLDLVFEDYLAHGAAMLTMSSEVKASCDTDVRLKHEEQLRDKEKLRLLAGYERLLAHLKACQVSFL